ncbi:DUF3325 domain-containing protein [Chitinivorax sp. B]|uniref:DUF3325 domain-containing protein n=1 Tax=Chitinivorax sp. B TaxID=2502235 RepID=UPI0010F60938|nr:DUF3325 domain-containing protein [Chitinivorax sp. B]
MWLLFFALCLTSFTLLALGMPRHFKTTIGREPTPFLSTFCKLAGWSGLAVALWGCIGWQGVQIGPVIWTACMILGGLLLVMVLLPFQLNRIKWLAWLHPALALGSLLASMT